MARILIVDDENTTVDMLSLVLSLSGHDPIPAYNGEQALEIIANGRPDLVLLDLMMPGIDGYETLRRLRKLPEGDGVPVIIVTASTDENLEERVHDAGADGCLRKPLDMTTLVEQISQYLET